MQLYKAGYKTIQTIAKAKPEELVNSIEHMSKKLASQLISAAKVRFTVKYSYILLL